MDFFEDQLVLHGYDWKAVVEKFMFEGKEPLVNCLVAGCILTPVFSTSTHANTNSGTSPDSPWLRF